VNDVGVGGIEFQLSVLLFFALLGYVVGTRFSRSVVVGAILVGVAVGPTVLGLVTYSPLVEVMAHIGAIFLLFVAGLECKFKEVYNARAFVVAAGGVVVPWVAGLLFAVWYGFSFIQSFFVGVALTATSVAITAQVLREMGWLDSVAGKAIIGAAVVDDVLGLLALSVLKQFVAGSFALSSLALIFVVALVFLAVSVFVGTRFVAPFLEYFNVWCGKHGKPNLTFFAAVAVAFFYSAVAEIVGLSAVVGAFVAGVSLESLKIRSYREGAEYFEVVFAAVFFVSLGVLVDLHAAWTSLSFWAFVLLLSVLAVVAKVVGCGGAARLMGLGRRDSLAVGVGMVPRGEIAFIVALFGLSSGLVGQQIYSAILLLGLLTTVVTPFLLSAVFVLGVKGRA
jgi:Kef-type K+ transport system membrane component KefB